MRGDLGRYALANARARTMLSSSLGLGSMAEWYALPNVDAMTEALAEHGRRRTSGRRAEPRIGERLRAIGQALLETLPDRERSFIRHYLLRHEVENLKIVIRAVNRRLAWSEVAEHITELPGISRLDPRALVTARDLRDLLDRLRATPYARPLASALHRLESAGPFALEVAIEIDYYERLWRAAGALESSDAERARDLLGILFDLLNLDWIARYRAVFQLTPEEILNYTLREGKWLDLERRRTLAEGVEPPWERALAGTPYAPLLHDVEAHDLAELPVTLWRFLARQAQRGLAGYPFQIGSVLGVLLSVEIEIRDLRVLLTAKRLCLPQAEALEHVATVRG
jgi:V/A-type H+-transporting ATPase subunit C